MATRQYIGARYVPIIDDEWDITKEYDPLVIVMYQGNSYTSRTFVPANTPITNTTYWALTGNYNAQVEHYRQEVEDLSDVVNNMKVVNVKDYGAIGDGVHDDTGAFQSAINTGLNIFIPLSNGEHYVISSTLLMKSDRQTIYSDNNRRVWDETCDLDSKIGSIYFTGTGALFDNNNYVALRFTNLTIVQGNYESGPTYYGTAFKLDNTSEKDNGDHIINGCAFYGFDKIVVNYGRGTQFVNNSVFHFGTCFEQHYTFDGTGGAETQQPTTGDRGIELKNNKFHYGNLVVNNVEGVLNGIAIISNYSDGINRFFTSSDSVKNSIISNNVLLHTKSSSTISITSGDVTNNVISGNTFDGSLNLTTQRFIHITNGVTSTKGLVINGNSFNGCTSDAIFIEQSFENITIVSNTFNDVCSSGNTSNGVIRLNGNGSKLSVTSNTFKVATTSNTINSVNLTGTCDDTYILDNVGLVPKENQTNNAGKHVCLERVTAPYFDGFTPNATNNPLGFNIRALANGCSKVVEMTYTGDGSITSDTSGVVLLKGDFTQYSGRVLPCFVEFSGADTEVCNVRFTDTELKMYNRKNSTGIVRIMLSLHVL